MDKSELGHGSGPVGSVRLRWQEEHGRYRVEGFDWECYLDTRGHDSRWVVELHRAENSVSYVVSEYTLKATGDNIYDGADDGNAVIDEATEWLVAQFLF
jgi:hypothetical protein